MEDNTASECIHTVYGCKILQLHEYEVNEYGYEVKCE